MKPAFVVNRETAAYRRVIRGDSLVAIVQTTAATDGPMSAGGENE